MKKDLTTSSIDRQNILNNPYALSEIEKATGIQGIPFEGKTVVLKDQAASFFEVSSRTIEKGPEIKNAQLGGHFDVPEVYFGNIGPLNR